MWYGLPTIASRFLGYLMNMALPFFVAMPGDTADLVQVYTIIPFLNVLYSYGMETAYFRFAQTHDKQKLYNTLSISLLCSTIIFSLLLLLFKSNITSVADLEQSPNFVLWMIAIIAVDNLATLPFARLRLENRPKRYAFARIAGITLNVIIVFTFVGYLPAHLEKHPDSLFSLVFNKDIGLGYYLIGNLCGSLFTLLILSKELKKIHFSFDGVLWKEVMKYSAPLVIVGLGGMTNDVMSRLIYRHAVGLPLDQANHELGVFANIFRIALLVTIMIQAFRMAAEPFFFNQSNRDDAQKTYARITKFFVIACCFMFLFIALFLDIFKWIFVHFANPRWAEGLEIVPLLALGNIFLGVYYNLSIWYKLTNKNNYGAVITLIGAAITIIANIVLIPIWHYAGAAVATFLCYSFMMVCSYIWGQKHYPVPYPVKKLIGYLVTVVLLYGVHRLITWIMPERLWLSVILGIILTGLFALLISNTEKREITRMLQSLKKKPLTS